MQIALRRMISNDRFKIPYPAGDLDMAVAVPSPPPEESESEASQQLDDVEMLVPDEPVVSPVPWWLCCIVLYILLF